MQPDCQYRVERPIHDSFDEAVKGANFCCLEVMTQLYRIYGHLRKTGHYCRQKVTLQRRGWYISRFGLKSRVSGIRLFIVLRRLNFLNLRFKRKTYCCVTYHVPKYNYFVFLSISLLCLNVIWLTGALKCIPSNDRMRWLLIEFSISVFNEEDAKAECNEKRQKMEWGWRFQIA